MKGTYQGDEKLLLKAKKAHVCYIHIRVNLKEDNSGVCFESLLGPVPPLIIML